MELFNAVNNNDFFYLQEVIMANPGIDLNQPVIGSMTALHVAAEKGYSSCVTGLISAGAHVDAVDEHGVTALMNGITAGYPLVVLRLLQAQCKCDLSTYCGMTALHFAARLGSVGVTQLLLMAGANPDMWNVEGESPLSIALKTYNSEIINLLLLGCTFVNPNAIGGDVRCPNPLLRCLQVCRFAIGRTLLVAGYRGNFELRQFLSQESKLKESDLDSTECNSLMFLTQGALPLTLQGQCRLKIRRLLKGKIWHRVHQLHLPQQMKDFVCYKEIFRPPAMNSDQEAYKFFNDSSREIYELV